MNIKDLSIAKLRKLVNGLEDMGYKVNGINFNTLMVNGINYTTVKEIEIATGFKLKK